MFWDDCYNVIVTDLLREFPKNQWLQEDVLGVGRLLSGTGINYIYSLDWNGNFSRVVGSKLYCF